MGPLSCCHWQGNFTVTQGEPQPQHSGRGRLRPWEVAEGEASQMLRLPEQCLFLPVKAGALCALPVLQIPYLKYLTAGVALPGPPFSILPNLSRSL